MDKGLVVIMLLVFACPAIMLFIIAREIREGWPKTYITLITLCVITSIGGFIGFVMLMINS